MSYQGPLSGCSRILSSPRGNGHFMMDSEKPSCDISNFEFSQNKFNGDHTSCLGVVPGCSRNPTSSEKWPLMMDSENRHATYQTSSLCKTNSMVVKQVGSDLLRVVPEFSVPPRKWSLHEGYRKSSSDISNIMVLQN